MLPMIVNRQQKHVAVCTNGDESSAVQGHLDWALRNRADILVCACRSRGETVNVIQKFARRHSLQALAINCVRTNPLTHANIAAADQAIANQIERLL